MVSIDGESMHGVTMFPAWGPTGWNVGAIWAEVSSEVWHSLPTHVIVGRIQFLASVWLRSFFPCLLSVQNLFSDPCHAIPLRQSTVWPFAFFKANRRTSAAMSSLLCLHLIRCNPPRMVPFWLTEREVMRGLHHICKLPFAIACKVVRVVASHHIHQSHALHRRSYTGSIH